MNQKTATQSQRDKFLSTARELGCDESEERFDAALRKVANAPVVPDSKEGKTKKAPR